MLVMKIYVLVVVHLPLPKLSAMYLPLFAVWYAELHDEGKSIPKLQDITGLCKNEKLIMIS